MSAHVASAPHPALPALNNSHIPNCFSLLLLKLVRELSGVGCDRPGDGFLLPSLTRGFGPSEARAEGKRFGSHGELLCFLCLDPNVLFPKAERMHTRNPALSVALASQEVRDATFASLRSAWVTYEFKGNLNSSGRPSLKLERNELGT